MEIQLKQVYLDTIILFNRREIQLRFLERELYGELFKIAPEYFDVLVPSDEMFDEIQKKAQEDWEKLGKKSKKWTDIFENTPLFKISKKD